MGKRKRRSAAKKVGAAPGTLIYTGEGSEHAVKLDTFTYSAHHCERTSLDRVDEHLRPPPGALRWVNVDGVHDLATLETLGAALDLHPLTLEDIASVAQRPKFEAYDGYHYVVLRMLRFVDGEDGERVLDDEQVSILVLPSIVVTFQERPGDVLDPLRERLEGGRGRVRRMGPDYLLYAILDLVIDQYFLVLEAFTTRLEELEPALMRGGNVLPHLEQVHAVRRDLSGLRRTIWATRDMLSALLRSELDTVSPEVRTFLRDAHDHCMQVLETVELLRETASTLHERYLALVSMRMNEVMKVLTVIATIFIPLTFIAGVYGMNFEHMPELASPWGYPLTLLGMAAAAGGMLLYFRNRRWL